MLTLEQKTKDNIVFELQMFALNFITVHSTAADISQTKKTQTPEPMTNKHLPYWR